MPQIKLIHHTTTNVELLKSNSTALMYLAPNSSIGSVVSARAPQLRAFHPSRVNSVSHNGSRRSTLIFFVLLKFVIFFTNPAVFAICFTTNFFFVVFHINTIHFFKPQKKPPWGARFGVGVTKTIYIHIPQDELVGQQRSD